MRRGIAGNVTLQSASVVEGPGITTVRHQPVTVIRKLDTGSIFRSLFYQTVLHSLTKQIALTEESDIADIFSGFTPPYEVFLSGSFFHANPISTVKLS